MKGILNVFVESEYALEPSGHRMKPAYYYYYYMEHPDRACSPAALHKNKKTVYAIF